MKNALMTLVVMVAAADLSWAQPAPGTVRVYVDPGTTDNENFTPGSTFVVAIKCDVNWQYPFIAADLALDYDATVLEFVSQTYGDFWESDGPSGDFGTPSPGHYYMAAFDFGNVPPGVGTYTIVTLTFTVLSVGSTTLTLTVGDDMRGDPSNPNEWPLLFDDTTAPVPATQVDHGSFSNVPPPPVTPPGGTGGSGGGGGGGCSAAGNVASPMVLVLLLVAAVLLRK